ncbi:MAG: hypothetical protein HY321_04185 [Armatimonadetes bacterium]|nr:hypothetical protein [Armatimonadota bacterium]
MTPGTPRPAQQPAAPPIVEVEEDVYSFEPANNGSGPTWCYGSTSLVRIGERVFASGMETLKDASPLNNCRWMLFAREPDGWKKVRVDPSGRTREPCPLVGFPDGRLFLSANPTIAKDPAARTGPARPEILQFRAADPEAAPRTLLPQWEGDPPFAEHSYRTFAADGENHGLILFQNIGYTHAEWSFLDREGAWRARGRIIWPRGADYEEPQPVRVCYPNVALRDRAVHFCGVSDIIEPNREWRAYKEGLTGRKGHYDFRRLFYTWTPDITAEPFAPWTEIASREKTSGSVSPGDLWVAPDGAIHVLWTEQAMDAHLRDRFYPGEKQSHALNYAVIRDGSVVRRQTLCLAEEGRSDEAPGTGRFQVTPDHRLFVLYYVSGKSAEGSPVSENRLVEIHTDGSVSPPIRVPLAQPFRRFFTATTRGGSPPSAAMELFGHRADTPQTMSYARIRLS